MTAQLSEYFLFEKGGTESLPDVFLLELYHGVTSSFFNIGILPVHTSQKPVLTVGPFLA
jgi:hypothetical protein